MIENLQFELKVEQMKVDKIRKEWQYKKDAYTNQITSLAQSNNQKTEILDKLERELRDMRSKVQFFYESYQSKESENEQLKSLNKEIQADKFKIEVDFVREKERNTKLLLDLENLQKSNNQLSKQIIEQRDICKKIDIEKQQLQSDKLKEWDRAKEFLTIITQNSQQKSYQPLTIIQLMTKAMEQIFAMNEKRIQSDFDLMEQRLKLTQQNMRKMKMEFQKVNSERVFYKSIYKKRIINESIHDNVLTTLNPDRMSQSQLQHQRNGSTQKSNLFQEMLIKQSKGVNEILGLVEDKRTSSINTLQISPIKMFNLEREITKNNLQMEYDNQEQSESENNYMMTDMDTFRSKDVDMALEKAQHLMKFKHDREFINKVLDAQIRVNEIEQNIIKNATQSSTKRSTSKSSQKKPTKDSKQTKYDYGAMTASRPIRN